VKKNGKIALKQKTCKNCKALFTPARSFQKACSYKCAIELSNALSWKLERIAMKEKLKTLGQYKNDARVYFQKWIRKRDDKLPCISCGKFANRYDAGHYFKAELYSGLIFDEDNCHKQCVRCNKELHGNESNYRIGLVKKIGLIRVEWLENNKDRLRIYKYTKEELINIKNEYKNRL